MLDPAQHAVKIAAIDIECLAEIGQRRVDVSRIEPGPHRRRWIHGSVCMNRGWHGNMWVRATSEAVDRPPESDENDGVERHGCKRKEEA